LPEASENPAADLGECQPLDLALPSGEPLDLTGSWLGDDLGPYELRQFGDCLWWVGQNLTYTYVLTGTLAPDFTITGRWATIAASDRRIGTAVNYGYNWIGTGSIVLRVEFVDQGTNDDVVLTKIDISEDSGFEPGFPIAVTRWTRVDGDPDHPIPAPSPD
jgi:hypothetical protein